VPQRCSYAEQAAGNIDEGEAPMLLREPLEVGLDENLNGLLAGINLDTNRRVAKGRPRALSGFSANDGLGHCDDRPSPTFCRRSVITGWSQERRESAA
jgi:hypothetical protein